MPEEIALFGGTGRERNGRAAQDQDLPGVLYAHAVIEAVRVGAGGIPAFAVFSE